MFMFFKNMKICTATFEKTRLKFQSKIKLKVLLVPEWGQIFGANPQQDVGDRIIMAKTDSCISK